MEYMTAQQAAELWGISDRRVRILCSEGKIAGAEKVGKSYHIPADAKKPVDRRLKENDTLRYLKWDDAVIGTIAPSNEVTFIAPHFNDVVSLYTQGMTYWPAERFTEFLSERVVSRERRDIEKILYRCGLSHYDVGQIAEITRGIHPKDLLWIASHENDTLVSAMTDVFASVFRQKIDMQGDSIDTPEGYNIKRYGVMDGRYGIYKQRINPLVTDVESEIAVYLLAKRMGVPCCPAVRADKNTVFSAFLYDFSKEYIVHFRRFFDGPRGDNEYRNLLDVRPQYKDDIARMILLDFITRQDDRHLSNIAVKISSRKESFYPLYDNGRSLFYEDTEETVQNAVNDVAGYATSFGYSGTYWDYVREIARENAHYKDLIDLSLTRDEVASILNKAEIKGYRFDGALEWICAAIRMIQCL
ncbi:MAG: helix-turn-helix domain-containing protein [Eubacteriales bacterium]|nr:helix-turn-helix domain-containing protein [Eubacteriales bacterium]